MFYQPSKTSRSNMKFGKQIQKRQLEVPEYAASFVNYKALKKLIKKLSATPILVAQNDIYRSNGPVDSQAALQANKATFFFQLERELDKVNAFYLQKEAELKIRLKTLLDKKKVLQTRDGISRRSSKFTTLEEGFQQFATDLNKLQQFVEINGTAFSKILKKWDKTSKSKTKELYLSRAVEVQPFFNATVISELSDQATTSLQELGAWSDGIQINFQSPGHVVTSQHFMGTDEGDADTLLLDTVISGNLEQLRDLLTKMQSTSSPSESESSLPDRVTRTFLTAIHDAPQEALRVLLDTGLVDLQSYDDINERNCLHQATIYGKPYVLEWGLQAGVSVDRTDVYGRVPLHYASLHGRLDMLEALLKALVNTATINLIDHDNFTPLIHSIIHCHLDCIERLLERSARIDPASDSDHVPLNLACEHGSEAVVELLLKHGAKLLPDAEGLYPQHLVARSGRTSKLLLLLKQHGADLDQIDKLYGWTPLVHAASEGNVDCLQALLKMGVDVHIVDEKDLPAIYYAAWEGHLECMKLLTPFNTRVRASPLISQPSIGSMNSSSAPAPMLLDPDAIPILELPPPIIPLRRYGHNFLDTKTVVQISFDDAPEQPLVFFQDGKYPAARLTISSKLSDLIPKNIILPFQEDTRMVSFQVDNLDTFSLDFDVFPTYGAKIIAKTVVLPNAFKSQHAGISKCCLPLFDPRLRAIGQISFSTQVIQPFKGQPLEITDFETYWKATSQFNKPTNAVVTGSSLSGDYLRIFVQYTSDGIPVIWPQWTINCGGLDIPLCRLSLQQFEAVTSQNPSRARLNDLKSATVDQMSEIYRVLTSAGVTLKDALAMLPSEVNVNLQILYPSQEEEKVLALGPALDVNVFVDAILTIVFDHARSQRAQLQSPDVARSMVFSSYNPRLCTALNWKQPNFPVFLCNDLGREAANEPNTIQTSGRRSMSIKEVVRIAQSNNFMGLMCYSRLLDMVPALVDAIKSQGLTLVMDKSTDSEGTNLVKDPFPRPPKGVDGVLRNHGILRFNDSIDM
ncbi:anaphase-promoting complex subunit Apc3 [Claviceps maximensis]|nr:anaphase-promoting complex subunit Apc3 [Claviceps maximensis]